MSVHLGPGCSMCGRPSSTPGLNARGEPCPCRCHPPQDTAVEEDPYHVARFTGGEP